MPYTLQQFDDIRPYSPEELPAAFESLLNDRQFNAIMHGFAPWLPKTLRNGIFRLMFRGVKTALDFQRRFMKPVVKLVLHKCAKGSTFAYPENMDKNRNYTFISNHRDIVLDSAILDIMLDDAGFSNSCEIAIGDNLLIYPWIRTLVKINKSFTVKRSLPVRQMLEASVHMSQYMHFAVTQKHENIWIAQREGRAKDSDDRTQESVLKMLALGGEGSTIDRLKEMNIVPLTISYEFDPCDYLKAEEFQNKRDDSSFRKSKQDDLLNMKTGILGFKGRVHYQAAPCINPWLDTLDPDMPKAELIAAVARHLDQEIHRNYHLYPSNYVAHELISGIDPEDVDYREKYTDKERVAFEKYLDTQISKVRLQNPDHAYLRERMLTMYANPAINHSKAVKQ